MSTGNEMVHRRLFSASVASVLVALAACHDGSSGAAAAPLTTNTGLAIASVIGEGDTRVLLVRELAQGRDLDGDGDLLDDVVHVLDLATGAIRNTGFVIGSSRGRGDVVPTPLAALAAPGAQLALGVSEVATGSRDLNGDGDALDDVLMLLDEETGAITNLELAVSRVVFAGELVAFNVPEAAQGEDLDGDGSVDPFTTVPHFHDPATGATWNAGLRGARILEADGERVALAEREDVVGDRNGDGDELDIVLAFHDPLQDELASAGLALPVFNGFAARPIPHRGRWTVFVDERSQGQGDLDGDGALGTTLFVHDPATGDSRHMPGFGQIPLRDVEPFVFLEFGPGPSFVWLYDPDADRLLSTGWTTRGIQSFGDRLLLSVDEAEQGLDLDEDNGFESEVPVVYDPGTEEARSTGIDGFPTIAGSRLVILSSELRALRDWNGDGDLEDWVLHVWDPAASRAVNTRIATRDLAAFGDGLVLFLRSEDEERRDLNADGDRADDVAAVLDASTGGVTELGLASSFLLGIGGSGARGLLPVREHDQGADLNGDGDRTDEVLFLVDARAIRD